MRFAASIFVLLSVTVALASAAVIEKRDDSTDTGDKTFPACDTDPNATEMKASGVGFSWQVSDDPNFYLAPGKGSCGRNYTDQSNVVCVNPGWMKSASKVNHCDTWVQVYNPTNGVVTQGIVWDTCGAVKNSTFGCNDIYVSKRMFEQLAGNQREAQLAAGRIDGQLQWRTIVEPCWGCYAGLPGKFVNGSADTCTGQDQQGFTRCGHKSGGNRIVGTPVNDVCNIDVTDCSTASTTAATLPKYQGSTKNALHDATNCHLNPTHPTNEKQTTPKKHPNTTNKQSKKQSKKPSK